MNPEVEKMRKRIKDYNQRHPGATDVPGIKPVRRKKMHTRKHLKKGTKCAYCGKLLSTHTATRDHIVPLSRGGTHNPDNLCWCCWKCNQSKKSKFVEEWKCT